MTTTRTTIFRAVGVGLLAVGLAAGPAAAGDLGPPVDFSPAEGPPGTVVTVSGNCFDDFELSKWEPVPWIIDVALVPPVGDPVEGSTTSGPEDDWSIELTVADDATPGDEWEVTATCYPDYPISDTQFSDGVLGRQVRGFDYESGTFLVTQPATTTTEAATTTTEATTTTAAAAPAVAAAPSFTG